MLSSAPGRLHRDWVVRGATPLAPQRATQLAAKLVAGVVANIRASVANDTPEAAIERNLPVIVITPFDEVHAVVSIDFGGPEIAVGDSAVIAQYGALTQLDQEWRIVELQGLPARAWPFFRP